MRRRRGGAFLAAPVVALLSCTAAPAPSPPDPEGVVRIAPLPVGPEGEETEPPFDAETRARNLARRFPGVKSIDFVRVLLVPEERSGTCWTEVSRPWETRIDLRYAIDGESGSASGIAAAKDAGWWPIYRSPEGFGFERRASFESLDVEVGARFACRCVGEAVRAEGDWRPLELRLRWEAGGMPEISATGERRGRLRVLTPSAVYGHLLTWNFASTSDFGPGERARCGLRATVEILNDPPIL